jgi:hypothetical protein
MGWATFWASFSQTHQVTLDVTHNDISMLVFFAFCYYEQFSSEVHMYVWHRYN